MDRSMKATENGSMKMTELVYKRVCKSVTADQSVKRTDTELVNKTTSQSQVRNKVCIAHNTAAAKNTI